MLCHASSTRPALLQHSDIKISLVARDWALLPAGTAGQAAQAGNRAVGSPSALPAIRQWQPFAKGDWSNRRRRPRAELRHASETTFSTPTPDGLLSAVIRETEAQHAAVHSDGSSEPEGLYPDQVSLTTQGAERQSWEWVQGALPLAAAAAMLAAGPALASTEVADVGRASGALNNLSEFQSGFASSFLLIIFSEIGDKTFFIAALLATRQSNLAVFTGTFGALAVMTVISVMLGRVFHFVDEAFPITLGSGELPLDDIAAVILLVYFGISTLLDAGAMDGSKAEEEQQEAELAIASVGADGGALKTTGTTVAAVFVLVFVAEWGDKSFFSTIALAAASSPLGVVLGGMAGHGAATALAVLGGSLLGSYISEKAIAYVGGALFLVFAAVTSVEVWSKISA